VDTTQAGLGGGIHGTSGNAGYSEGIAGVINICGALGDSTYVEAGGVPLVSLHGTNDGTVPYGTDLISVVGIYDIMIVDGSHSIHQKAQQVGLNECLFTYQGADHVPHVGSAAYRDTTLNVIKNFMYELVCNGSGQCGYLVNTPEPEKLTNVQLFPNPANDRFTLQIPVGVAFDFEMTDMNGRVIRTFNGADQTVEVERNGLPSGLYLIRGTSKAGIWTGKVVFE
jgi:hypothetical protein